MWPCLKLAMGVYVIESPEARKGSLKYHKLAAAEEVIKKMSVKTISSDEVKWILPDH